MSKSTLENNTSHHIAIFIIIRSSRKKEKRAKYSGLVHIVSSSSFIYTLWIYCCLAKHSLLISILSATRYILIAFVAWNSRKRDKRKMFQWMVFTRSKGSVFFRFVLPPFILECPKKDQHGHSAQYKWSNGRMNKTAKKKKVRWQIIFRVLFFTSANWGVTSIIISWIPSKCNITLTCLRHSYTILCTCIGDFVSVPTEKAWPKWQIVPIAKIVIFLS